jgi:hypothetical protein
VLRLEIILFFQLTISLNSFCGLKKLFEASFQLRVRFENFEFSEKKRAASCPIGHGVLNFGGLGLNLLTYRNFILLVEI